MSKKKSFFSGLFFRVFVVFSFLFFTQNLYSQEATITGLDNVHISEGATIIEKKSNNDIIAITSNGTQKILNSVEGNSYKKELLAKKKNETKNRIAKNSRKKIIKSKEISKPVIVYNKNANTENSFQSSDFNLKQINTNQNNYNSKFINPESSWIEYLYITELKQAVLFQVHNSIIVKKLFFTRPPPTLYS